jgi:hypothetical protein
MNILFDQNYPQYVLDALQLVHKLDTSHSYTVASWTKEIEGIEKPVVFILDRSPRGIDIITQKHYDDGYKVFAFKLKKRAKMDFFLFALTILNIWPEVLKISKTADKPFVYTYRYGGRKPKKIIE